MSFTFFPSALIICIRTFVTTQVTYMKSLRLLAFIATFSVSFSAFAIQNIGSGTIIGPGGDSGFSGGGDGGGAGGGPGGSIGGVGVGTATLEPGGLLPATGISLPSTPQFGINDIKIVGTNCVISKLGISIAIAATGTSPCTKLYPQGTAGGAGSGTGTGVGTGVGTSTNINTQSY